MCRKEHGAPPPATGTGRLGEGPPESEGRSEGPPRIGRDRLGQVPPEAHAEDVDAGSRRSPRSEDAGAAAEPRRQGTGDGATHDEVDLRSGPLPVAVPVLVPVRDLEAARATGRGPTVHPEGEHRLEAQARIGDHRGPQPGVKPSTPARGNAQAPFRPFKADTDPLSAPGSARQDAPSSGPFGCPRATAVTTRAPSARMQGVRPATAWPPGRSGP